MPDTKPENTHNPFRSRLRSDFTKVNIGYILTGLYTIKVPVIRNTSNSILT